MRNKTLILMKIHRLAINSSLDKEIYALYTNFVDAYLAAE